MNAITSWIVVGIVCVATARSVSASGATGSPAPLSLSLDVVSRSDWGARPPGRGWVRMAEPVPAVVIHHTASPGQCATTDKCIRAMRSMQNYHMDTRKWNDIGYTFCVGGDGSVYEGRGWGVQGSHAPPLNGKSIGICMIGDFSKTSPPAAMVQAAQRLVAQGVADGHISPTYELLGHRDVRRTSCPGDTFYEELKSWPHFKKEGQ